MTSVPPAAVEETVRVLVLVLVRGAVKVTVLPLVSMLTAPGVAAKRDETSCEFPGAHWRVPPPKVMMPVVPSELVPKLQRCHYRSLWCQQRRCYCR